MKAASRWKTCMNRDNSVLEKYLQTANAVNEIAWNALHAPLINAVQGLAIGSAATDALLNFSQFDFFSLPQFTLLRRHTFNEALSTGLLI
jgi:hypothetical protein